MKTYISTLRDQYRKDRELILMFTGMSDVEHYTFQVEQFVAWLEKHTDFEDLERLASHPVLWKWWLNEWHLADHHHILPLLKTERPNNRLKKYTEMHRSYFFISQVPYDLINSAIESF